MRLKQDEKDILIVRDALKCRRLDIGGRDILIAFNEPAFKYSRKDLAEGDLDAKLNARLASYFLPAVQVARAQSRRPRLFVVSGLNLALKWNAKTPRQKKIMMINNGLKMDFLKHFFEAFFSDDFSIVEYIISQDPIKISEEKLLGLWKILERKRLKEIEELKYSLAKFKRPKLFSGKILSEEAKTFLDSQDEELLNAFKYAISHLFIMADLNFEGNYIHNPVGYLTIGGSKESVFNIVRALALETLKDVAAVFFEREVLYMDNLRLVLEDEYHVPPPYNGYFTSSGKSGKHRTQLAEVTYENERSLDYYDTVKRLRPDLEYLYENFVPRDQYEAFWKDYRDRYFELKKRYREAYQLEEDF